MAAPTPSIEKLQKKLEKEPNSLIFLQLAEEYRKESLHEDALRICKDGLRRHPNYWSARVAMGRIYREMGQQESAREELEKVTRAVPDNLLANKLLGDIYMESGRLPDAFKRYQIVQMLTPNDQEVVANLHKIESQLMASAPERPAEPAADVGSAEEAPAPADVPDVPEFLEKTAPGAKSSSAAFFDSTMPQDVPSVSDVNAPHPEPPPAPDSADLAALFMESAHSNEIPVAPPFASSEEEQFPAYTTPAAEFSAALLDQPAAAPEAPPRSEDRTQPMQDKKDKEDMGEFEGDELTTQTLAELYVQQGLTDKAVRVFQKLLLNDPGNSQIVQRLKELSPADAFFSSAAEQGREPSPEVSGMAARGAAPAGPKSNQQAEDRQRKITTLENWLMAIRRERS